jgi:hypothetical protein
MQRGQGIAGNGDIEMTKKTFRTLGYCVCRCTGTSSTVSLVSSTAET